MKARKADQRVITVALAGQPNVGKSTLFNMLTGLSQRVGNWPGKTVERKEGTFRHNGATVHIVDLPGTYSLTANSPEERIARDYIIREKPDIVVAVSDATVLERNLYLTAELLSFPVPVVLALNMAVGSLGDPSPVGVRSPPRRPGSTLLVDLTIGLSVWHRSIAFLKRAGSIILIVSMVVWLFATLPGGEIETSYLAWVGRLLAPVGELMGLDWRMMVALFASFIAKENAIATLGVLFGNGEERLGLIEALAASLTPAAALAFLVVEMLFIPCMATVATIYQETRSWRWTGFNAVFLLAVSFAAGILVYQGMRLLG